MMVRQGFFAHHVKSFCRHAHKEIKASMAAKAPPASTLSRNGVAICCVCFVLLFLCGSCAASRVLLVGSRGLSSQFAPLVFRVVAAFRSARRSAAVGCASGADSFALQACLALQVPVEVFAVGSRAGSGFWRCSAPLAALRAAGSAVHWLAGGPLSVGLSARLVGRSRAALASLCLFGSRAGVVGFLSSPSSRGSVATLVRAAAQGLPVVVFPCGFCPSRLPALGSGCWVVAGAGVWASAFKWQSA